MSDNEPVSDREPTDPSPEQIRKRSEAIRRGWSMRVTQRRQVSPATPWRAPLVLTIEVVRQLNEQQEC